MWDPEVLAQARTRMEELTKPPRALGYLEEVALWETLDP
ncbi:nicotinate-nucleotide--dimethylbenzimidazole phosphoribosyltransferase, partial [Thermus scotoductus]